MTREDLQQIAELMEQQNKRMAEMVDAKLQPINDRLQALEQGQEELRTEMRHTRVLVEHQNHDIQLIAEQYGDIAKKLDKANERAAQVDDLKDRVRTLETVVMNHTAAIKELRKAE